jgi:hypothetical protein
MPPLAAFQQAAADYIVEEDHQMQEALHQMSGTIHAQIRDMGVAKIDALASQAISSLSKVQQEAQRLILPNIAPMFKVQQEVQRLSLSEVFPTFQIDWMRGIGYPGHRRLRPEGRSEPALERGRD